MNTGTKVTTGATATTHDKISRLIDDIESIPAMDFAGRAKGFHDLRAAIEAARELHDRMLAHEWIRPSLGLDEDAPYRFDFYAQEIEKLKAELKKFERNGSDQRNDNDNRKRRGEPVAWLPIETAPEEGCWALVCGDGAMDCMFIKKGHAPENWTNPNNPNLTPCEVSHWMPLPEFAPQPAEPDYKQLFEQMCERCDALDAKLAEYSEREPVGYHPCTSILIEGLKRLQGGSAILAEWDRARSKVDSSQSLSESEIPTEPSRSEPRVSTTQVLITLGKVIAGYRPGEEGWSEHDQHAYDAAMTVTSHYS